MKQSGKDMKVKYAAAFLCFWLSSLSHAGSQVGSIVDLWVRASDGLIYFSLSGGRTPPPCAAAHGYWMIRDENSNVGKQQYAMLLAAKLSGKTVAVLGLGTCTRWPDGEDVDEIRIVD